MGTTTRIPIRYAEMWAGFARGTPAGHGIGRWRSCGLPLPDLYVALENKFDAKHLSAPPNDLADPVLSTLKKCQLEAIRDRFLDDEFCAVP